MNLAMARGFKYKYKADYQFKSQLKCFQCLQLATRRPRKLIKITCGLAPCKMRFSSKVRKLFSKVASILNTMKTKTLFLHICFFIGFGVINVSANAQDVQTVTVTGARPPPPIPSGGLGKAGMPEFAGLANKSMPGDGHKGAIARNNSDTKDEANPSTCTPVVLATGEKWLEQPDFTAAGAHALSFGRKYRSITRSVFAYFFGPGWQSTFDHGRLDSSSGGCDYDYDSNICYPRTAVLSDQDGTEYRYESDGLYSSWFYPNGIRSDTDYVIFMPGSGWQHSKGRKQANYSVGGFITSTLTRDPKGH